jgi:uncharacterized protein with NAD-binding domain and iron-sulfur cluster
MVLQEGFLRSRDGANVGWAKVGLSTMLGGAALSYLKARGGDVLTTVGLREVEVGAGAVARAHTDAGDIVADAYVIALPSESVLSVLPVSVTGDPFFSRIRRIESSPIVNVHLWYDQPVWDRTFAAFLNTPVQWVFNKSRIWGLDGPQYLDISLSGAREWIDVPAPVIRDHFVKEMRALLPRARGTELVKSLVVKQREATFAARPGVARLRPAQATPVRNLFLAGDWTATGWPATMESAVRSGRAAARGVLRHLAASDSAVSTVSSL